jgi:hypothetical protein
MTFIRLVAFLEHLSEILSKKRTEKRQFGEHTRPGCGVRRPRRARGSVGSKADKASYHSHREDHRANVTRLAAKALSGGTPDNHTRGRVCSPIPTAAALIVQQPAKFSSSQLSSRNCLLRIVLASLAMVASLQAASPTLVENPAATPAPAGSPLSLKDTVPVESLGDSVVARHTGFEVVPGKDPNGWSFILEPYLWGLGVDGTVGAKRFDTHVDYNPLTVVKHLDWGIMAKGEVRKGKWGILGDGFFAQLSASGDPPGPLYNNANIKLQQGMVELALAYRIIDDRRAFLDIYAGARYNYFGIDIDASVDDAGIQDVSDDAAQRIFGAVGARVQGAVDAEVQKLASFGDEEAILEDDARNRIALGVESDLQTRLRRELASSDPLREAVSDADVIRIARGLSGEYRAFLDAVLEERLAQARARLDPGEAQAVANAQARVAQAEKKLSKALSKELENRLPTSKSGDQWWIDPIIGLRTQINFTRWLFLALQGDVGGFGAGSQIAWFASGSIGINFTRNIFLETGYRYFYMDHVENEVTYDAAQSGLFMGVGLKF